MKKLPYFLLFLLIIGGILYKIFGSDSSSYSKISPIENWEEILIGKWKFFHGYRSFDKQFNNQIIGDVTYTNDGRFEKYLSLKFYDYYYVENHNPLLLAGGKLQGKWEIKNKKLFETIEYCGIKVSNGYRQYLGHKPCEKEFSIGEIFEYGEYNSDTCRYKIESFSKKEIFIKGEDFSNDGEIEISFTRIDK